MRQTPDKMRAWLTLLRKKMNLKSLVVTLAAIVVFTTTYLLILPAFTLDKDEAIQQGGIDVVAEETAAMETDSESVEAGDSKDSEVVTTDAKDEKSDEQAKTEKSDKDSKADDQKSSQSKGGPLQAEGNGFTVSATPAGKSDVPDSAELQVEELKSTDKDLKDYREEALEALKKDSDDVKGIKEIKVYDMSLESDGKAVDTNAKFNVKIEYEEGVTVEDADNVRVLTFDDKKKAEVLDAKENKVETKVEETGKKSNVTEASFETEGISKVAVVEVETIEKTVITADGNTYKVTVKYDKNAQIPDGATLDVKELTGDEYDAYLEKTADKLDKSADDLGMAKFFDITIKNGDEEVKIANPVDVEIKLLDGNLAKEPQVLHFIDDDTSELIDSKVDGDTVKFEAEGFSVYAIVDDTNAKYVFHNANGQEYYFVNKEGATTTYQRVAVGGTLYNPGVPESPAGDNMQFMGWWTKSGSNWDKQIIPPNVDSVKPDLSSLEEGTSTTIDLYARFDATYYLVYHDQTNENILSTETVTTNQNVSLLDSETVGTENEKLRVELVLSAEDAENHVFLGWATDPDKTSEEDVVKTVSFSGGTLELYPVIADAYWINFDKNDWKYEENTNGTGQYALINGEYVICPEGYTGQTYNRAGTGATYVSPRFVLRGESYSDRYSNNVPESTRPGYEFQGWFYDKGLTQQFNPSTKLTENVTVYAKWERGNSVYSVQYWLQNNDGIGYTLTDVDLKTWSGLTDTMTEISGDTPITVNGTSTTIAKKYDYFKLHEAAPGAEDDDYVIVNKTIKGDGSTVIDVYYDRQTYTLRFIYARSHYTGNNTMAYEVANSVQEYCLTSNNAWSQSWSTIQTGMHNLPNSSGWGGTDRWTDVDDLPTINMQSNFIKGTFTETYNGTEYTYYYFDIAHLYYNQNISSAWPQPTNVMNPAATGMPFVSWGTQARSPYWLKANKGNQDLNNAPSGGVGDFTIKGPYAKLDELMLNVENNGNTVVNGTDLLANVFAGRYNTNPHEYKYHIFVDLLDGETGTRTYQNVSYKEYEGSPYTVYSSTNPSLQAKLAVDGMKFIAGPLNNNNQSPGTTSSSSAVDLYYYYQREVFTLKIVPNVPGQSHDSAVIDVKFGEDISNYLNFTGDEDAPGKNPFDYEKRNPTDLTTGEIYTDPNTGYKYVFSGWYSNPEGVGREVDLSGKIMDSNLIVYGNWRPLRYRVWVQPNGGELTSTESTWFNIDQGETVENYADVTRDYLKDPNGEYIYVIYDHENDLRTAKYIKESEATEDQLAHALRDGDAIVHYTYLKNAYTFVGWYEVLNKEDEIGTYEQYNANGLLSEDGKASNDGCYTVRPPEIKENDTLSGSSYIFGTPVDHDIAIRAVWKRSGTIAVRFLPSDPVSGKTGIVPEAEAAKETEGDHAGVYITSYNMTTGDPETWSANPQPGDRIYPMTQQVFADLSQEKAVGAPDAPENYYFVGWRTPYGAIVEPNDVFSIYADLADVIPGGADGEPWYLYTLTAVYAQIGTVELTYDANGGVGTLTNLGSQTGNDAIIEDENGIKNVILNQDVTLSTGDGFTRDGYVLVGWSKTPGDNNTVDFELGSDIAFVDDENSTLYAVWDRVIEVKFTKKQSRTNAALSGATFTLYSDSECNNSIGTATSDDNGLVKFTLESSYTGSTVYFKETGVPEGYLENNEKYTVSSIALGETPENDTYEITGNGGADTRLSGSFSGGYVIMNKPSAIDLKIVKVAEDGTTYLDEAVFKLLHNSEAIAPTDTSGIQQDGSSYKMTSGETGLTYINLIDGTYTLTEVGAPDGYIITTDTTTIVIENGEIVSSNVSGEDATLSKTITTNSDTGNSLYTIAITNHPGSSLPMTGGIGTTIFYILGSLLVIGCGIVLVSRKRMGSKK